MDTKKNEEMSQYGKFHFRFIGFNLKSIVTGKVYRKGDFWDNFRSLAKEHANILKPNEILIPPDGFKLIEYKPLS